MIVPFKWYLHDSKDDFAWHMGKVLDKAEIDIEEHDAILQRVGMPFYEVTLECELDTETVKVTVLKTSL